MCFHKFCFKCRFYPVVCIYMQYECDNLHFHQLTIIHRGISIDRLVSTENVVEILLVGTVSQSVMMMMMMNITTKVQIGCLLFIGAWKRWLSPQMCAFCLYNILGLVILNVTATTAFGNDHFGGALFFSFFF